MKIEIDLDDLGFHYDPEGDPIGNVSLRDAIVQAAVRLLLAGDFGRGVRQTVTDTVNTLAHEKAAALVEETFTAPIQRTTRWGETEGEPTTVREIVREAIEKWVQVPANRQNGSSNGVYRSLADLIDAEVRSVLTKELQAEIVRVKREVADQIRDRALAAAAASLSPAVR